MFFTGAMVAGGTTLGQSGGFTGITGSLATAGGISSGMITPREALDVVKIHEGDSDFSHGQGTGTGYGYGYEDAGFYYHEPEVPPEIRAFRQRFDEDFVVDGKPAFGPRFNMMA